MCFKTPYSLICQPPSWIPEWMNGLEWDVRNNINNNRPGLQVEQNTDFIISRIKGILRIKSDKNHVPGLTRIYLRFMSVYLKSNYLARTKRNMFANPGQQRLETVTEYFKTSN